jgi:outer membrane protein
MKSHNSTLTSQEVTVIRTLSSISTLFLLTVTLAVFAQGQVKIGYVNSAKVLQEFPEAQEAQHKLDAMGKQWQGELEKMEKELQVKYDDYQKKEPLLKDDEKRAQRDDLMALQQKGIQYRQSKFGNDGELALATDSLLRPIKQKVMKVIEQVAKQEKIQFMFDRNDQILVLLYGEAKFDYTNLVIDKLKRGASK